MADGGVEEVGVLAKVYEAQKALSDLVKLEKGYDNFVGATDRAGAASGKASSGLTTLSVVMGVVSGGTTALVTAIGSTLVGAFHAASDAITGTLNSLVEFATTSLMVAGRVDELQRSALLLGQRAGYSAEEVRSFLDGLAGVGIRADVSATLVSQLARNQADLAIATDLASVAQNAAVVAGIDSSDALESLTRAAVTNQVEVARTAGVQVNFTKAQEEFARTLGTSREALTEQQKIQANFNAILSEGAKIAGVYAVAQGSPTKALRSLGREIYNLQAALGAPFLSAFSTVVGIMRQFVQILTQAVQEGGALYPVLVQLGAIASLIADGLSAGFDLLVAQVTGIQDTIIETLAKTIDSALAIGVQIVTQLAVGLIGGSAEVLNVVIQIGTSILDEYGEIAAQSFGYGAEMVVQLAEGIIAAASQALVAAMNFVGSILSSWLAPGSDPKVAPLSKWGREDMAQFLKGMTEADFGILDKLTGIFQSALGSKGLAGVIDDLLSAISMGEVTDEIFAEIAGTSAVLGTELAELTKRELALAKATEKLTASNKAYEEAQNAVGQLTREYNQMVREGATEAELAAKKEKIDAAVEARDQAAKENAEAKKGLGNLEEEAKLQNQLVRQLTKLLDLKGELSGGGAGGGAAGGGGAGVGGIGGLGGLGDLGGAGGIGDFDIGTSIEDAIKEAKQNLIDEFTGENSPFSPLIDAWEQDIAPKLERLKLTLLGGTNEAGESVVGLIPTLQQFASDISDTFGDIESTVRESYGSVMTYISNLRAGWENNWGTIQSTMIVAWATIQTIWIVLQDTVLAVVGVFTSTIWPSLQNAFNSITNALGSLGITWSDVWQAVLTAVKIVGTAIGAIILGIVGIITGVFTAIAALAEHFGSVVGQFVSVFKMGIESIANIVGGIMAIITGIFTGNWSLWYEGFKALWEGVFGLVVAAFGGILVFINATFGTIVALIAGFITGVIEFFQNLYDNLVGNSIIPDLMSSMLTLITDGMNAILEFWQGIWNSVMDFITETVKPAFDKIVDDILSPIKSAFDDIASAVQWVIDKINSLIGKLSGLELPDFLQPGSPPPLYHALKDIGTAMKELSQADIPELQRSLNFNVGGGSQFSAPTQRATNVDARTTIGPNTFSAPIDLMKLDQFVNASVRRALGGV